VVSARKLAIQLTSWAADLEFEISGRPFGLLRRIHFRLLQIQYEQPAWIGREFYLKNIGNLKIGHSCAIGSFSKMWNYVEISIGDDFRGAGCLTINTATHDPVTLSDIGAPVCIGDRVWCGLNVTILAGVTIGDDVVIGAGSVVISDLPANCVAAGVPARKIRDLNRTADASIAKWMDS